MRSAYTTLLAYDNVRIFYFQNDTERITNLDNYKDFSHYCTEYNRHMLDCFVSGEGEIFADNCAQILDGMRRIVTTYNADALFADIAAAQSAAASAGAGS